MKINLYLFLALLACASVPAASAQPAPDSEPVPAAEATPAEAPASDVPAAPAEQPVAKPAAPAAPPPRASDQRASLPSEKQSAETAVPEGSDAPGMSHSASFFTRYELRRRYDTLGRSAGRFVEGDVVVYRARIGLTTAPRAVGRGHTVTLGFTPQASGYMGEIGNTVADSALGLHEGWLRLDGDRFALEAGRFVMNYGDALIIGNLDWHQTARSFQGARLMLTPTGTYRVDMFITQIAEGRPLAEPFAAGDNYFYGIYANLGPMIANLNNLDIYALGLSWPTTNNVLINPDDPAQGTATRRAATRVTLGARIKHQTGALDYRAEAGIQLGTALAAPGQDPASVWAYQGDAEIGVTMLRGRARAGIEALIASGDDPDSAAQEGWDHLFPTAHKWLGLADIFGARSNVASGVAHVMYRPAHALTAKLDAHIFARVQEVGGAKGYAGAEIDTQLIHALGKGFKIRGLYAIFVPDRDLYGTKKTAHYLEVELRYDIE